MEEYWEPVGAIVEVLKAAKCFSDSEPTWKSVQRIVGERDTERSYAEKLRKQITAASEREVELNKRIKRLESEILRIQAPAGASYGHNGDRPIPSFKPLPLPEVDTEEPLRARCGRQRRELRRLNQRQRLAALQLEKQEHTTEALVVELLATRSALRVAEAVNK